MSAFASAIDPLVDELATFVSDPRCKLLQVHVGVELRQAVLEVVLAHEHRLDNVSPFVLFEHDHTARTPGWSARVEHARAQHEQRRDGAEPPIPALPPAPTASDGRISFALQLQQLSIAAPADTEGFVVVLAPQVLDAHETWRESVELLLASRDLAGVRWIVVETETNALDKLVASHAESARRIDVRVSNDAAIAEVEQLATRPGGAGPSGVTPPWRKDVPAPPDAAGLRRIELGRLVLSAALAASRGRPVEAVAAQRRARDVCESAGWSDEAIAMELVLGGHLVAAGAVREAETSFLRAIEAARKHERPDKIATAGFGLGAVRTIRGERHTALVAYAEAAIAAEESRSVLLAIEGSRLAGQAALDLRMEPQAITFFGRAVRLAEESTEDVSGTSAGLAARTLAALCRRRRMPEIATDLDAQAERFARSDRARTDDVVLFAKQPPTPIEAEERERTSVLTFEEIARIHWGGIADSPSPPQEGSRSWTRDEIRTLQHAVDRSLDGRTSEILSRRELLALHGESVEDTPPELFVADETEPSAPARIDVDDAAGGPPPLAEPQPEPPPPLVLAPLPAGLVVPEDDRVALQTAVARMRAFGEGRIVMRRDELELIRKYMAPKQVDAEDAEDAG